MKLIKYYMAALIGFIAGSVATVKTDTTAEGLALFAIIGLALWLPAAYLTKRVKTVE